MTRKSLTIAVLIIQLIILGSFMARYEYLKATGTALYIPLRGYDPTDIFRGDYVNLSYELPHDGVHDSYGKRSYILPEVEGNRITRIKEIVDKKPEAGVFFEISSGWGNTSESYKISSSGGVTVDYTGPCSNELTPGTGVRYIENPTQGIISITPITDTIPQWDKETQYKTGSITSKGSCITSYRFRTTATDRWFVQEGTGMDLEKKILKGDMYAKWIVGSNGATIISDVVESKDIPK